MTDYYVLEKGHSVITVLTESPHIVMLKELANSLAFGGLGEEWGGIETCKTAVQSKTNEKYYLRAWEAFRVQLYLSSLVPQSLVDMCTHKSRRDYCTPWVRRTVCCYTPEQSTVH